MRRLGSLAVLLVLGVGTPLALLRFGFYGWDRLNLWAPADFRVPLGLLSVVGWAAWAVFVVSVVLEAARLVTHGRVTIRVPGFGLPQSLAAGLLAAIIATSGSSLSMAAPPQLAPVTALASTDTVAPQASVTAVGEDHSESAAPRRAAVETLDQHTVVHLVSAGDDLWSLAERYYGSGAEWRKIVRANPDLLASDPTADLTPGTALAIAGPTASALGPSDSAEGASGDSEAGGPSTLANVTVASEEYTVEKGDTLWHLAEERLGDGHRYPELQRLNSGVIDDPDYIETGWTIALPPEDVTGTETTAQEAAAPTPNAGPPVFPGEGPTPAGSPAATPSAAPSSTAQQPEAAVAAEDSPGVLDSMALRVALGGLGALAASGILGGVLARRRERVASRELGRTFPPADEELRRFETALGLASADTDSAPSWGTDDSGPGEPSSRRVDLVDRAMRLLAEHWEATGQRPPRLRRAVLTDTTLDFVFDTAPASAPDIFDVDADAAATIARVGWADLEVASEAERGVAYPGLVTLGRDASGHLVMIDVVTWGVLAVDAPEAELPIASLSAMIVELSCSPWSDELSLRVVTSDPSFTDAAALADVRCVPDAEAALSDLERLRRDRHALVRLAEAGYDTLRLDRDRADAWAPVVFVFEDAPDAAQLLRIRRAVDGERLGLAALIPLTDAVADADSASAPDRPRLRLAPQAMSPEPRALLEPAGIEVTAQTIAPATRAAVSRLLAGARTTDTLPASWWREEILDAVRDERPDDGLDEDDALDEDNALDEGGAWGLVTSAAGEPGSFDDEVATAEVSDAFEEDAGLTEASFVGSAVEPVAPPLPATQADEAREDRVLDGPDPEGGNQLEPAAPPTLRVLRGPRLRLFGDVTLEGAQGTPPSKAQRRCLEYCAWLLEHPGATASDMTTALFVTDGTRRSNMSRLRSWLGTAADGEPFLPDAYSGRIALAPAVTSDWAELRQLVASGVNHTSPDRLRAALTLVTGAPMADAAPGEWAWAGQLRVEMAEVVRDVAVVLARAELRRGDITGARWACERGRLVVPDDELLACELMRVESLSGSPEQVDAVLRQLRRAADRNGTDLRPDTVALAQELIEGRRRTTLRTGSDG